MMPSPGMKLTYDDFVHFPEDGMRHELIDGEHYVTAAPNTKHQTVSINLTVLIGSWLERHPIGRLFHAPFDVVFSNAVLEHVGARERQRRFVGEALRVGRSVFITTPNRRFPVEVHTRLPLVHWLPDRLSRPVYRAAGKGFATDVHLLTRRSFEALFPGRVRIVSLGLTLVAIVD